MRQLTTVRLAGILALVLLLRAVPSVADDNQMLTGLRAQYFAGTGFSKLISERLDPTVDYGEGIPAMDSAGERFSARWTGMLQIPDDGQYTLRIDADDSARVWLGQTLVLDTREQAEVKLIEAKVKLREGDLSLRVDYLQDGGTSHVRLMWSGPGFDLRPIARKHLRTAPWPGMRPYDLEALDKDHRGKTVERKPGWRARFFEGTEFEKFKTELLDRRISYHNRYPLSDGRKEDLSARLTGVLNIERRGKYTFYLSSDDGQRMWINHRLVIDYWTGHGMEERKVTLELDRGTHPIMVEHFQGGGSCGLLLEWSGPKLSRRLLDDRYVSSRPWQNMKKARPLVNFLALGHSNMEGRAKSRRDDACPNGWWFHQGQWSAARKENGPMWPLLHELTEAYPQVDFGVVKVARSAATLRRNFLPGKREYNELVKQAKAASSAGRIMGMISMQGWVEVERRGKPEAAEQFLKNYGKLITEFRKDIGRPDLPWFASQVEDGTGKKKGNRERLWNAIYKAIDKLPDRTDNLWVIDAMNLGMVDDHHFNRKGNEEWAKRALKVIRKSGVLRGIEKIKPQPVVEAVSPAKVTDPSTVIADVEAVVQKATKGRPIKQLGTYKNLLVVNEYKVRKVRKGKLPGKRVLVVEFAVRNGKSTDCRGLKRGQKRRLRLGSWRAQEKLRSLPMDDEINDFDSPLYFALN
ncbi:MAG: PA14 domain-containing protein [Phycisphaerae bacterium]